MTSFTTVVGEREKDYRIESNSRMTKVKDWVGGCGEVVVTTGTSVLDRDGWTYCVIGGVKEGRELEWDGQVRGYVLSRHFFPFHAIR